MKKIKLFLCLFFIVNVLYAQEWKFPFWSDIEAFKKQDSVQSPPKHAILFIGSSSFTNWKDVKDYFPGYTIINRGFGGSTLLDQIRYVNDIVFPYKPKQIVIYCGENDLASSDTVTSEIVFKRFTTLFNLIRKKLPDVPVVFISIKPSPSRWFLRQKMITANSKIKSFLATKKKTVFVDVYHKMLGADGLPLQAIFLEDNLHMNAKGYAIWQKQIKPHLKN
ncbi:MAG TPA: GDSL-type esterase/lipase family protein [Chitinophagaceae bacterium]|jgi:lysophospholipase L1-like esterase|nr:GDSL-type esterase/lipase family protein [Chitinophagaceae bacterium]